MITYPARAARLLGHAMLLAAVLAGAREVESATLNVPGDYPSIQSAIDVAASGDTVLVAAGTYRERLDFLGKSLEVVSVSGPQATFIDAAGSGTVVTFQRGEPRAAVLSGFTITNGNSFDGAGVRIWNSSPTLHGNVITGNRGCTGVGVYSYFSSPRIEQNTISGNVVQGCSGAWGVGVYIGGSSSAELVANEIVDNAGADASGGGVALFAAGRPLLLLNIIARNSTTINGTCGWGGGVAIANYVEATIVNNLIAQNKACTGRAIYWIGPSSSGATTVVNNTIVDHAGGTEPSIYMSGVGSANRFINNVVSATGGPAIFCQATSWATGPAFDSNDIFSNAATPYGGSCADQTGIANNISIDPAFRNPLVGDYSIDASSPLVDAGNNAAPHLPSTDLTGGPRIASAAGAPDRIDIGAYEFYNQGPTADAGADQTVTANSSCVATVTLSGSGVDPEGDPLTFTWSGSFGEVTGATTSVTLGAGLHVVTLTVTDGRGGRTTDTVTVSVLDSTPPVIASLSASPSVLTKANHDMVTVTVAPTATDTCGGTVTCRIVSVSSNEPVAGTGGGDLSPDWEITGNLTVRLRAERAAKGNGRVYLITVRCTDAAGNASTSTVSVAVPRR